MGVQELHAQAEVFDQGMRGPQRGARAHVVVVGNGKIGRLRFALGYRNLPLPVHGSGLFQFPGDFPHVGIKFAAENTQIMRLEAEFSLCLDFHRTAVVEFDGEELVHETSPNMLSRRRDAGFDPEILYFTI